MNEVEREREVGGGGGAREEEKREEEEKETGRVWRETDRLQRQKAETREKLRGINCAPARACSRMRAYTRAHVIADGSV